MRILLIEDYKTTADYATRGLSESGYVCDLLSDRSPRMRHVRWQRGHAPFALNERPRLAQGKPERIKKP